MSSQRIRRGLLIGTPLLLAALAVGLWSLIGRDADGDGDGGDGNGRTRTYYIAAVERSWSYAPDGRDRVHGGGFGEDASVFVRRGPGRIGAIYTKALFREFTGPDFTTEKP